MTQEELKEFEKILGGYCWYQDGGNGGYDFNDVTKYINNLLQSRQEKMIEEIKEMSLCYADDSIENEMDYITGQAHFKHHIIDMFNQGLDKGIEIIKNKNV